MAFQRMSPYFSELKPGSLVLEARFFFFLSYFLKGCLICCIIILKKFIKCLVFKRQVVLDSERCLSNICLSLLHFEEHSSDRSRSAPARAT